MSLEAVKQYFKEQDMESRVMEFQQSSATVEEAAAAIRCEPRQLAKTMSFLVDENPIVIVASGDTKIDNAKYKSVFGTKAKMIPFARVEELTGHIPGGISPFACKANVKVYLDESLKRFDIVYTGGGDEHNTVEVTIPVLEKLSEYKSWIDVCKGW